MAPASQLAEGLSITLSHAFPAAPWMAVAVVVTKSDHGHRITFVADQPMEDVFYKEIVDVISPILDGFSDKDGVCSNPDVSISLPGLTMEQLRVIYSTHGTALHEY